MDRAQFNLDFKVQEHWLKLCKKIIHMYTNWDNSYDF